MVDPPIFGLTHNHKTVRASMWAVFVQFSLSASPGLDMGPFLMTHPIQFANIWYLIEFLMYAPLPILTLTFKRGKSGIVKSS